MKKQNKTKKEKKNRHCLFYNHWQMLNCVASHYEQGGTVVWPLVRVVQSSIPADITSLFQLLSFCIALTSLKWSIDGERGVK